MDYADVQSRRRIVLDHVIDIATVVLISLASVATAWCGYEAARWNDLQALNYSRVNTAHVDASIASDRSNTLRMIDIGLFVQYENALFRHDTAFAAYIKRRFRPEFRAALDAWLKTKPYTNARAPLSPFAMPEYRLRTDEAFAAATQRARVRLDEAVNANDLSDKYVFVTVLFASVTFLSGVAMKARYPFNATLTIVAAVLLLVSIARFFNYPIR